MDQRTGNLEQALLGAKNIQRLHPDSALGYRLAGEILSKSGRLEEAIISFTSGLERAPDSRLTVDLFLARLNAAETDPSKQAYAVQELEQWLAVNPTDLLATRHYAGALIRLGELEKGIRLYESISQALPDDPAVLNSLALAYHKMGDPRALGYAQKALEYAPEAASILDTVGWLLVDQGEPGKALRYLREARIRAPSVPDVQFHLGVALHQLGRDTEALNELNGVLSEHPVFDGSDDAQALVSKLSFLPQDDMPELSN